jgi:hypothetical protein
MLATPALEILEARKEASLGNIARGALLVGALSGSAHNPQAPAPLPAPVAAPTASSVPAFHGWHGTLGKPTYVPGQRPGQPLASASFVPTSRDYHAEAQFGPYGAGLELSRLPQGESGVTVEHPLIRAATLALGKRQYQIPNTGITTRIQGDNFDVMYHPPR